MVRGSSEEFLVNWGSQVRKGVLELVIMSMLAQREFYGYDLAENVRSHCSLELNDGTLYAILSRLRNEGFVRHRWEHASSGPGRKYYTLTQSGHKALAAMSAAWRDIVAAVDESRKSIGESDV